MVIFTSNRDHSFGLDILATCIDSETLLTTHHSSATCNHLISDSDERKRINLFICLENKRRLSVGASCLGLVRLNSLGRNIQFKANKAHPRTTDKHIYRVLGIHETAAPGFAHQPWACLCVRVRVHVPPTQSFIPPRPSQSRCEADVTISSSPPESELPSVGRRLRRPRQRGFGFAGSWIWILRGVNVRIGEPHAREEGGEMGWG
ncbi:hypothetical protein K438DRAFT_1851387 [Mycena galopus ATCC 62051]|nr:hypothetical protein K438DRAFT_1851387 [Mycena galopus ATCC 62051]